MSRKTLTFVTGNKRKLEEFVLMLGDECSHLNIVSQSLELPEMQGEPEDISIAKCRRAAELIGGSAGGAVVVEDTSLCFNAHKGLPGPYIKWYLAKLGVSTLPRLLYGFEDKSARAVCIFAFSDNEGRSVRLFNGEVEGHIVEARGAEHFGWDPCFQPLGSEKTFAQMTKQEKNAISHRARALEKLKDFLINHYN